MRFGLLLACLCAAAPCAPAQETPPRVITEQRGGTSIEPPASVDPVFVPEPRGEVAAHLPPRFSAELSLDVPLRHGGTASLGRGTQGSTAVSPTLQARLRWRPDPQAYWFGQLVFYRYLRGDRQQPWHPDFSYSFGWDDWRPRSWSLFYANYTGTRFHPDAGQGRFNFREGQWTLRYNYLLPPALEDLLLVGDGDAAACNVALHLTPRYVDFRDGSLRSWRKALATGCRYTRPEGWYAELALFAYPDGSQQQPWDPDFTYGFGYEVLVEPGVLRLRYNNWSGNRFPGRARGAGEGSFRSGSLNVGWEVAW